MKMVFAGLVLIVGTLTVNIGDVSNTREQQHGDANAPVCPPGQVAKFVGVINGKATWECVPAGT
jgi:hypothetical protein